MLLLLAQAAQALRGLVAQRVLVVQILFLQELLLLSVVAAVDQQRLQEVLFQVVQAGAVDM
jgi:hypothetical protein